MTTHSLHFKDSATPANIESGSLVAAYVNGYKWSNRDIYRMSGHFMVSVEREPFWAHVARCIDVESGAASVGDVVPFIHARLDTGHRDATVYVNRSNWDAVRARVEHAGLSCRYWVATLDGTMLVEDEWATQYQGGPLAPYDLSVCHGLADFVRG